MTNKEGSLYKSITVLGRTFHIYYGYYSEREREPWDLRPLFPDFLKTPIYTVEHMPFARADQDVCAHYEEKQNASGENWCNDCKHFQKGEELIGVCRCERRRNILRSKE